MDMELKEIHSISADLGDAVLMSNDPNMFQDKIQIHEREGSTRPAIPRSSWRGRNGRLRIPTL